MGGGEGIIRSKQSEISKSYANIVKEDAGRPSAASSSTVASILRRRMSWGRCPFLGHSFWDPSLEEAYQKYSHRQRRKSLVVVNLIDIILKVGFFKLLLFD
ncbi:hypothetical protein TNCV_2314701 [Trichonephila clavipes]|nr:hypothetical protein TNCV_2314701 [Trichonephila clavipes]